MQFPHEIPIIHIYKELLDVVGLFSKYRWIGVQSKRSLLVGGWLGNDKKTDIASGTNLGKKVVVWIVLFAH